MKKHRKTDAWYLYILRCSDGSLYTGIAKDPSERLAAHRGGGGSKYVRSRLPVRRVYLESCAGRSRALKREAEIKSWTHLEKLALIGEERRRRHP